jgi:hypothetical protein
LLEAVKGQIRAFDAKAQVAIGINGVLVGFLISEFTKAAEFAALGFPWRLAGVCVITGLSLVCSVAAIVLGVRVIHPQLHLRQPHSRFFFCHIAEEFGGDFVRAGESLASLSDEESLRDVTSQIAVNAYVCNVKAKRCKPTLLLTAAAFFLYAVSIFPFASMAFSASRIPSHSAAPTPENHTPQSGVSTLLPPPPFTGIAYAVPIATIIGALVALSGVVVTLRVSRQNAKEQNGLASRMKLADFREKWINNLRDATSELAGVLLSIRNGSETTELRRTFELATKTKLLMNKSDVRYPELISLLEAIINNDDNGASSHKLASDLGDLTQDVLRTEWGVLKRDLEYEPPRVKR